MLLRSDGDLLNNISAALYAEPSRNLPRERDASSSEQDSLKALSQPLSPTYSRQVEVPVTLVIADLGCGRPISEITKALHLMLTSSVFCSILA